MKHLEYIDGLKGFAIFLVVFAHVIAWSYGDLDTFLTNIRASWLFWVVYSFHMPLFFAVSGYLAYRSFEHTTPWEMIKKRTIQLLLPYVAIELFVNLVLQQTMNYWFLIALYWMYVVTSVSQKVKLAYPVLLYVLIYGITILFPKLNEIDYLFIPSFKDHYLSFLIGFYLCKYPKFYQISREYFFKYSLLCFFILYIPMVLCTDIESYRQMWGGKIFMVYRFLKSTCGVIFFFFLFEKECNKIPFISWFSQIGKNTLIIYMIHVLFKFAIPPLGDAVNNYLDYPVLLQIVYSLPLTVLMIYISLYTKVLLEKDKVISIILLGKNNEK